MFDNRRILELTFLGMVILSALLLGIGQSNLTLAFIAIGLAIISWVLVDWLDLFRLPRWVANVLSIGVLFLTMGRFFGRESGSQLIAVANLLVYLQSLLLMQEKSPRQYWQLVVLNLLQVVVASIFTLNLEGGVVFLVYMVLVAFFLFLLTNYDEEFRTRLLNLEGEQDQSFLFWSSSRRPRANNDIRLTFEPKKLSGDFFRSAIGHLVPWIVGCLAFSLVLFVLIPRSQEAWFAVKMSSVSQTGASKSVNLNERGRINMSGESVMRVSFSNTETIERIQIEGNPYFRGLALSKLVIKDNATTWEAPYDRVFLSDYVTLTQVTPRELRTGKFVNVDYTLEATSDPLIYATMPVFAQPGLSVEFENCITLSAVTRARQSDVIEQAPFQYRLVCRINENGTLPESFPYESPSRAISTQTLEGCPGDFNALIDMDSNRYPELVRTAKRLADEVPSKNHREICRRVENHFLNPTLYQYTLDYTGVSRDTTLDPIEDFVRNHHQGHCELFASAMVLMLRCQGIPARLVVGYCGGEWISDFYSVNNMYAHAWVEAYLSPEFCTDQMRNEGGAGPGGAWLRLDPTPATALYANTNVSSGRSLFLARTLWQEYVLGLDDQNQIDLMTSPSTSLMGFLDIGEWSARVQDSVNKVQNSPTLQVIVIVIGIIVLSLSTALTFRLGRPTVKTATKGKAGFVKRLAARALSLLSPSLGNWLLAENTKTISIPFYEKFLTLLRRHGIVRDSAVTHLELAQNVTEKLAKSGAETQSVDAVSHIVERFHEVRFGGRNLGEIERGEVEKDLRILEKEFSNVALKGSQN